MSIRDEYVASVGEIRTSRRDAEQAAHREMATLKALGETTASAIGRLDEELEAALAQIRAEFRERQKSLEARREELDEQIADWAAKSQQARRDSEERLAKRALWAAREVERALTAQEAQLRSLAEISRRRERILSTDAASARVYSEHAQIREFLTSMKRTDQLPVSALQAVLHTLAADLKAKEAQLLKAGVPLDPVSAPTPGELLMLYDVGEPAGTGSPALYVLAPCLFSRFEDPRFDTPPLTLRIAAGIVKAVADVQRTLCNSQVPVTYARADDMLIVRGPLTEQVNLREAAEMLEGELNLAVREVAAAADAKVEPAAQQLGPGVLATLVPDAAPAKEGG